MQKVEFDEQCFVMLIECTQKYNLFILYWIPLYLVKHLGVMCFKLIGNKIPVCKHAVVHYGLNAFNTQTIGFSLINNEFGKREFQMYLMSNSSVLISILLMFVT